MKLLVAALLAAVAALAAPMVAAAHPLGNFTTNQYTEIVASGDSLYVASVLDLAEIPTFQAKADVERLGRRRYAGSLGREVRDGLTVRVDGSTRSLRELDRRLSFPRGAASLRTTRLELVFDAGPLAGEDASIAVRNDAFGSRIGWKELVIAANRGATVDSDAPAVSVSDRLRSYPKDLLSSPLDVRSAVATARGGDAPGIAPGLGGRVQEAGGRAGAAGGFTSLVARDEFGLGFILSALVLAMFWGAAHALTPGHGKAIVAAYLIGAKGRPRDAFALGGIVTVTHTIGVFTLGIATLALSEIIVPEDLYPWMNLVSALLVVVVGVAVLRQRVLVARGRGKHECGHEHSHGHVHDDGHHHGHGAAHQHDHHGMTEEEHAQAHLPREGAGTRGLLAVGISGGLLPCPTALVVLLAAISLHRVAFGLALIVAFSVGLASVISAIGLIAIGARDTFRRKTFQGPIVRALPAVSALLVFGIGIAMTVRALPAVT